MDFPTLLDKKKISQARKGIKSPFYNFDILLYYYKITMTRRFSEDPVDGETFKYQNQLPKLPIPDLANTAKRYLDALKPLQVTLNGMLLL